MMDQLSAVGDGVARTASAGVSSREGRLTVYGPRLERAPIEGGRHDRAVGGGPVRGPGDALLDDRLASRQGRIGPTHPHPLGPPGPERYAGANGACSR